MASDLIEELQWRGLIAQASDIDGLSEHLATGSRTVYCGFDPTAESLHIGNLVSLLVLRRFQQQGHRPILLVGGATGLIGDPSFKDSERQLNSRDVVAGWVDSIRVQAERFVEFEGNNAALVCNNIEWTESLDVLTFLRDIGKHFSVNAMIQREAVKGRLEKAEQGISYTEFSYMLLQAMDYLRLAERYGCSLQVGGSDQWGNIVSGMDLVRRHLGQEAYALTTPLVTKADGTKFGKTESGTVWLSAELTSPYAFYQFWLNSADADVVNYLKIFTFLDQQTINSLQQDLADHPEQRNAQRRLAEEVTALVHGQDAVVSAQRISAALFGGDISALTEPDLEQLKLDGLASTAVAAGEGLLSAMTAGGLAKSIGEARKLVQGGGVRLNGVVVEDAGSNLDFGDALYGRYFLLRRGKKVYHLFTEA